MNIEREKRIHTYLAQALDQPTANRQSYLEKVCGADSTGGEDSVLDDVLELLGLEQELSGFMEKPIWKGMIDVRNSAAQGVAVLR